MKTDLRLSGMVGMTLLAILLQPTACKTWQAQRAAPEVALASNPKTAIIVETDGTSWTLQDPFIAGDSIVGGIFVRETSSSDFALRRMAIPTAKVRNVVLRRFSAGRTVALVAGIGLTAVIVAAIASDPDDDALGPLGPPSTPPDTIDGFSCPIVYSWDGHRWRRDSGTFGGAIAASLSRTDVDNLDFASSSGGVLRLRVTNELDETDHIDALTVLTVDHDLQVTVAPDPSGRLYTLASPQSPVAAQDLAGRDVLARVRTTDAWGWESSLTLRDTISQVRDGVVLTFHHSGIAETGKLVIDANATPWATAMLGTFIAAHGTATQAWYDSLSEFPALARATQGALAREGFLTVSIWKHDAWVSQGIAWDAGPEVVKRQVIPLDLRDLTGDSVRVRLESVPGFWNIDHVALDESPDQSIQIHEMSAFRAIDQNGGDVSALLSEIDSDEYVAVKGDAAELSFRVPDVPPGMARSYVLKSSGWYHVHTLESGEPQIALLSRIGRESNALSRIATARFNSAVESVQMGIR